MEKEFYKKCIEAEVYAPYRSAKNKKKLSLFDIIWCKYVSPANANVLIRKMLYLHGRGGVYRIISKIYSTKLLRRYSIHVDTDANIEVGLRLPHPFAIAITGVDIGKNFTIAQGCTIGQKHGTHGASLARSRCVIGDNVTMYEKSSIIGPLRVSNGVKLGAHALLLNDAVTPGVYVGTPARLTGVDE